MKRISKTTNHPKRLWPCLGISFVCVLALATSAAAQTATPTASKNPSASAAKAKTFATPQQAADALIEAAEKYDVPLLDQIFGPDGEDIIITGEPARDRQMAAAFAAEAREKESVSVD